MERISFLTHKGKEILFVDLRDCPAAEVIQVTTQVQDVVTARPQGSMLVLTDLAGAELTHGAITRIKEVAAYDRPYVKRSAVMGSEGQPKIFFEALKNFSRREFHQTKTRE